jgi:sugar phosphate isomerase/epimerase
MKYSCYLQTAFTEGSAIPLEDWVAFAPSAGLDAIELIPSGWPLDWWKLRKWREALGRSPLKVSLVCTGNNFCTEGEARKQEIDRIEAHVAMAQDFGAPFVRVMDGRWDRDAMLVSRDKAVRQVVDGFKECLDRTQRYNVALAWENHPGCAGLFLDFFAEVLKKVKHPRLVVNFDTGNGARAGQNPLAFVRDEEIARRIAHVHVKDFKESADGWIVMNPVDGTVIDHKAIFRELKRRGYDGWISWEHAYGAPSRADLDLVARVIPHIKKMWEQA